MINHDLRILSGLGAKAFISLLSMRFHRLKIQTTRYSRAAEYLRFSLAAAFRRGVRLFLSLGAKAFATPLSARLHQTLIQA